MFNVDVSFDLLLVFDLACELELLSFSGRDHLSGQSFAITRAYARANGPNKRF